LRSRIRCAVYVDEDPGYTQFWYAGREPGLNLEGHDHFYTVGLNIGTPASQVPCSGIPWRPLLQPVVLDEWLAVSDPPTRPFTTVASWRGAYGSVEFQGRKYGQKAHEFRRYQCLPRLSPQRFEIALDIHPGDEKD